jgi:hypothetical protein
MKFLFPILFIVSFFIGCKKTEEKENAIGKITVNNAVYTFDKGSKQTSIGNIIVDGKLVKADLDMRLDLEVLFALIKSYSDTHLRIVPFQSAIFCAAYIDEFLRL